MDDPGPPVRPPDGYVFRRFPYEASTYRHHCPLVGDWRAGDVVRIAWIRRQGSEHVADRPLRVGMGAIVRWFGRREFGVDRRHARGAGGGAWHACGRMDWPGVARAAPRPLVRRPRRYRTGVGDAAQRVVQQSATDGRTG